MKLNSCQASHFTKEERILKSTLSTYALLLIIVTFYFLFYKKFLIVYKNKSENELSKKTNSIKYDLIYFWYFNPRDLLLTLIVLKKWYYFNQSNNVVNILEIKLCETAYYYLYDNNGLMVPC